MIGALITRGLTYVHNCTLSIYMFKILALQIVIAIFIMAVGWFWAMPILLMSATKLLKPASQRLSNFIIGASTGKLHNSFKFLTNIGFAVISFLDLESFIHHLVDAGFWWLYWQSSRELAILLFHGRLLLFFFFFKF